MMRELSCVEKGLVSEDKASIWLIKNGYFVFLRKQENIPIDLIAVHKESGDVLKLDVKSVSLRKTGKIGTRINRVCTKYQKQLGVRIMYVHENGECDLK
jgi:hypothetical protein|tara:strand:- start:122 stop:418 length:297 start_codon:yes stop_codon:yes gene_type:complete